MQYDLNKLRSWGLRFLVRDESGQVWAHEDVPVRGQSNGVGYWRIADRFLPPQLPDSVHFYVDTSTHRVVCTDEMALAEYQTKYNNHYAYYRKAKRTVCTPIFDCPFELAWEDEPFDLVGNGIVSALDMKQWENPPVF